MRHTIHRLRSQPGFALAAVLTLALGIGSTTAIFSAVNPVLFEPLPYPQANRIVTGWDYGVGGSRIDVTFGTYRELAERSTSFEAIAVVKPWQPILTGASQAERLDGQRVSTDYFRVLGVSPVLGRNFDAAEDRVNGPNVAVISDGLWRRRFGGDADVVGRAVRISDAVFTIVGVMPSGFDNVLAPLAEIWAPLQYDAALPPQGREWGHHLRLVARLRAGVTADRAARDIEAIGRSPVAGFSRPAWASLRRGLMVDGLQDDVTRAVKPALIAVLAAVAVVLVIACVNVTNLLLARGAQRRGELAVRAALGAGRSRLIRDVLAESLQLALIGGALGMVVAAIGARVFVALSPPELPRVNAIGIDATVFVFGLAVTTIVGLLAGLIPALHGSDGDLQIALQRRSSRTAGGHHRARRALVVVEMALALVLLVSAGLLLRSLQRLFDVAPGFDASHVLTMQVQTFGRRFNDEPARQRFVTDVIDAVRNVPGVASAAFTSQLPLSGDFVKYGVQLESVPSTNANEDQSAFRYAVTPGYLEAMRIPLRRGRLLDEGDAAGKPLAVLVNESLVKRKFPGRDPIGERVHVGDTNQPWYTIVGVVGDVKQASLAVGAADAAYTTVAQWYFPDNPLWLVVRARGDAAALATPVRNAIASIDKDQPVVRVATMDDLLARSAAERRFALILFEAFALAALVLAATGIYGVLSGSVTERMREIGVRSALGATRGDIVALVLGQGMTLTAVGIAIGLAGAAAASRAIATLLFGVSPLDPVTYSAVVALLIGVAAIACGAPAWRAARVDPATTLRTE